MFRYPAWAVNSYSSDPLAAKSVIIKSTGGFYCPEWQNGHPLQGDPYGRGIVYVDSKFEVAFSYKVGLLPRPVTEL